MVAMYIEQIIFAAIIFAIILITMFIKKIGKYRAIIAVVGIIGILTIGAYVGYNYYTEVPVVSLIGDKKITIQANETYKEQGVYVTYHKENVSDNVVTTGNVETNKPGMYTIKYTYTYNKDKVEEVERTIIVEDKEPPVINLKGKTEMTLYTDQKYTEPGYSAKDNIDGDLTNSVKSEKNIISNSKYEMIYTVCDSSKNEATAKRTITLIKRPVVSKPIETNNSTTSTNQTTSQTQDNKEEVNTSNSNSSTNTGIIYLTFDDGPSTDITPKILNILKEENVKATFFILNYTSGKEYLVKREANEGHSIGIHGYSHEYSQIYKSVDVYMENVTKLQSKIQASTGITTYITRFPGGSSNTVSKFNPGIMTILTKEVVNRGFKYYDWNVSSGDAGGAKNKTQVYNNVVKGLKPNRSNVVLMHDFSGNTKTLNALKSIIQYGKQNGYTFKTITKDTPMVTHTVNN